MIELAIVSFLAGLGLFFVGLQTLTDYLKIVTGKKCSEINCSFYKKRSSGCYFGRDIDFRYSKFVGNGLYLNRNGQGQSN